MSTHAAGTRKETADRLRDIESVTDAGLARLSVDDLLVELLDRVRDILDADTAAVLLLDAPAGQLVATAAAGHRGGGLPRGADPAGEGFRRAGRGREATRGHRGRPGRRRRQPRAPPEGHPLAARRSAPRGRPPPGRVARRHPRRPGTSATSTSTCCRWWPTASPWRPRPACPRPSGGPPSCSSAACSPSASRRCLDSTSRCRYIAGGEGDVGGDWYDLFTLPSGWVCMTVGDVVGRGLRAAAVMGRLRSALRAYALATRSDPAAILDLIDRMLRQFEPGEMATAVLALLEPSFAAPPPLACRSPARPSWPRRTARRPTSTLPVDPPLGVAPPASRRVTAVDVPPGAVVCLYSDGLVERRAVPLDARLQQLREAVTVRPGRGGLHDGDGPARWRRPADRRHRLAHRPPARPSFGRTTRLGRACRRRPRCATSAPRRSAGWRRSTPAPRT